VPFFQEGKEIKLNEQLSAVPELPTEKTGFIDAAKAFVTTEDTLFGPIARQLEEKVDDTFDPEFRPIDKLSKERPELVEYADTFVDVHNEAEYNRAMFHVEDELDQREIFSRAPTLVKLAAGLAGSVIDPLILIPYGGLAAKASRAARAGQGLITGAVTGLASSTIREGVLQAHQETRTEEETIINIAAETVLGGLLGGAVGALSKPLRSGITEPLKKAMKGEDFTVDVSTGSPKVVDDDSVGAARRQEKDGDLGLAHISENLVKFVSGFEFLRAPDLRAALSKNKSMQRLGEVLYNSNYIRNKNVDGIATLPNAQNPISAANDRIKVRLKEVTDDYLNYTGKGSIGSTFNRPKGIISEIEFNERMARNLSDSSRIDSIPQVNKAADRMRKDLKTRAKELEALDPDFKAIEDYVTRIWDRDILAIPGKRMRLNAKLKEYYKVTNKDGTPRTTVLDDLEAETLASESIEKIRGTSEAQNTMLAMSGKMAGKGGFKKHRQILIPDKEIEEFLVRDASRLYENYMARTSRMIETQKALKGAGFENISDVQRGIRANADSRIARETDPKKQLKIDAEAVKEMEVALDMYNSMLGILKRPGYTDRATDAILHYQFTSLLGGVTISSLSEAAMLPFRLGITNTLRESVIPMIRSFKTAKLAKDQLNDLAGAMDFETNAVLRSMGGMDDIQRVGDNKTAWDKFSQISSAGFTKATGIGWWTTGGRRMAAQISSATMMRKMVKGLEQSDIENFASKGLDAASVKQIAKQVKKHSTEHKGSYFANLDLWDDADAVAKFANAIQVDVESAILKPGVESLPLLVQKNNLARVIFQFKSFSNAATGKILVSGIQRRDKEVLIGAIMLAHLGGFSGMLKDLIADREVEEDYDKFLLDGIARSGFLGLVGTTVLDASLVYSNKKSRRFGADNIAGAIVGPSIGRIDDVVKAVERNVDGDVTDKDIKTAGRMLPYMNLFYIKALTERVFDKE